MTGVDDLWAMRTIFKIYMTFFCCFVVIHSSILSLVSDCDEDTKIDGNLFVEEP